MSQPSDESLGSVHVSSTPQERFEEFLQIRGMRMTEQRKVLLQHVFERHQHFDVDELIEQLPKRGEAGHVSRPTVYRTLNEFVEAGLLRRFELDGRSVYEHDYGYPAHDHFYCDKSGKLIEFHNRELVELIEKIAQQYDFQIASHRLIIYGASKEGREASRRTKRRQYMI
ncbi:MAG: Fur family transcriptional regulator [Planctomycetota bacterium]|nr:Fur family transcriptional regulator [Planctomycetota bacterium]